MASAIVPTAVAVACTWPSMDAATVCSLATVSGGSNGTTASMIAFADAVTATVAAAVSCAVHAASVSATRPKTNRTSVVFIVATLERSASGFLRQEPQSKGGPRC